MVLNNDTTVARDCIRRLVEVAEADGGSRILCPVVYYADPEDVIWYAGSEWDPAKIYNGGYEGRGERDIGQYRGVRDTGIATGAAMLMPRQVPEKSGLFAEELFLQGEDVEFSVRARRAGFGVAVVAEAKVWHHVSAASGGEFSPMITYYCTRNALHVARQYRRVGPLRRAAYEFGLVSLFLAHARHSDARAASWRAVFDGWRDYRAGRLGNRYEPARSTDRAD
jgi:GT2 family glycosyltransferase